MVQPCGVVTVYQLFWMYLFFHISAAPLRFCAGNAVLPVKAYFDSRLHRSADITAKVVPEAAKTVAASINFSSIIAVPKPSKVLPHFRFSLSFHGKQYRLPMRQIARQY
jgi:hypothetical protein